ncbi:hypothetical protein GCM10027063_39750 [Promicromonospora xylanilytica]
MDICSAPVVSTVCQETADGVATQAGSVALGIVSQFADGVGDVASFLIRSVWTLMESTTFVDLRTGEFTRVYDLVFGVAVFLMLAFFLLQLISGMLRREPGALARALSGLAKSVLGSFVVVTLTALLLEITDQVCLAMVTAAGTSMEAMGAELAVAGSLSVAGTIAAPMAGALLSLFLAGLAAGAALIVWFSLLMRKALLLLSVALAPLALAGASWDATRGWVARWAQFVVALIVSKLVLVVVFLLATTLTASPVSGDLAGLADKLAGVALLLVAGFAPYITYKAIAFMGFDMYHAMSIEQEAKAALNRPVPVTGGSAVAGGLAARNVQKVLGPDGGAGGASGRKALGAGGTGPSGAAGSAGQMGAMGAKAAGSTAGGSAAGGGAAGGAAAAAGPAAAVAVPLVVGAQVAKAAATAGPKAGSAVGQAADQQTGAAQTPTTSSGTRQPRATPAGPPPAAPGRDVPTVLPDRGGKR